MRVDATHHHFDRRSSIRHRKISRRLAEDLVRLAQFPVLAFKRLHAVGYLGRDARAPAAVDRKRDGATLCGEA